MSFGGSCSSWLGITLTIPLLKVKVNGASLGLAQEIGGLRRRWVSWPGGQGNLGPWLRIDARSGKGFGEGLYL